MTVLACQEGVPFQADAATGKALRAAAARLELSLRPSFPLLEERFGSFTVRGIVGTVELRPGHLLDISPKVATDEDWASAALDLLLPATRIEVAGDRRGGLSAYRNLLGVLAAVYADRLTRALRRDGPLLLMERRADVLPVLKGKLDTTHWARRASWQPHRLPVSFQELTADNTFTRAMASVAVTLAHHAPGPQIRGRLLTASRELRPGAAEHAPVDPRAALRRLPSQWGAYEPAWDIAVSVLQRKSLLASAGQRHGVSMVVEAWRLLETLLDRALHASVRVAGEHMFVMKVASKNRARLLTPIASSPGKRSHVIPDGRLMSQQGTTIATFETKYSRGTGTAPQREHVYQALTTAAACQSPLAVLAYPDSFDPVVWEVRGFEDCPARLVAIGLGLYRYRRGSGDRERGQRVYDLLATSLEQVSGPGAPA